MVDIANSRWKQQLESVERILVELQLTAIPTLVALNKADLVTEGMLAASLQQVTRESVRDAVAISASDSSTLEPLLEKAGAILARELVGGYGQRLWASQPLSRTA